MKTLANFRSTVMAGRDPAIQRMGNALACLAGWPGRSLSEPGHDDGIGDLRFPRPRITLRVSGATTAAHPSTRVRAAKNASAAKFLLPFQFKSCATLLLVAIGASCIRRRKTLSRHNRTPPAPPIPPAGGAIENRQPPKAPSPAAQTSVGNAGAISGSTPGGVKSPAVLDALLNLRVGG